MHSTLRAPAARNATRLPAGDGSAGETRGWLAGASSVGPIDGPPSPAISTTLRQTNGAAPQGRFDTRADAIGHRNHLGALVLPSQRIGASGRHRRHADRLAT
jgi:hypothetical protein